MILYGRLLVAVILCELFAVVILTAEEPEKQQECSECHKPIAEISKTLQCSKCKQVYHYECAAYDNEAFQSWLEKNGWMCKHCLMQEIKEKVIKYGKHAALSGGVAAAVLGGIPLVVGALGFGAAGVTGGSIAAAYQSAYLGGSIASGSVFSMLQSVGAAGLATTTQVAIGTLSSAATSVASYWTSSESATETED